MQKRSKSQKSGILKLSENLSKNHQPSTQKLLAGTISKFLSHQPQNSEMARPLTSVWTQGVFSNNLLFSAKINIQGQRRKRFLHSTVVNTDNCGHFIAFKRTIGVYKHSLLSATKNSSSESFYKSDICKSPTFFSPTF